MNDLLDNRLFAMRIVHGALCVAVATFAGVAFALGPAALAGGPAPPLILLTYLGAGLAVVNVLMAWFIPVPMATAWRKRVRGRLGTPEARVEAFAAYFPLLLVRAALLEGAAFAQLVFYLLEGQPLSLGLALGLLVFLLLLFPTRSGVEEWAAKQEELARQER